MITANGITTYVGVAVKALKKDVSESFVTKYAEKKVLIGVPFQGFCPIDAVRNTLIEKGYAGPEDFIGNGYVFMSENQ